MNLNITFLYAGILGIILVLLSLKVISIRLKEQVTLLDGNKKDLQYAIRAQGNFTEYTPMFLILFTLLSLASYPKFLLHILGIAFISGRLLHAYSLLHYEHKTGEVNLRVAGTITTFLVLIIQSIVCIRLFF